MKAVPIPQGVQLFVYDCCGNVRHITQIPTKKIKTKKATLDDQDGDLISMLNKWFAALKGGKVPAYFSNGPGHLAYVGDFIICDRDTRLSPCEMARRKRQAVPQ